MLYEIPRHQQQGLFYTMYHVSSNEKVVAEEAQHGLASSFPLTNIDDGFPLGKGFEPGSWSVICGRGRERYDNTGNRRLRVLVDCRLDEYKKANKSRIKKTAIVTSIVSSIREGSNNYGSFIKYDPLIQQWCEVSEEAAREKVGHLIRGRLLQLDPSKVEKKRERRKRLRKMKMQQQQQQQQPNNYFSSSSPSSSHPSS